MVSCREVSCLPEYNTAAAYLLAIQNEIKWKRAKKAATQEIADHIADQCFILSKNGLSDYDALQQTIKDLGSAQEIGQKLNALHRPKTNRPLLACTVMLLCLGMAADLCFLLQSLYPC